MNVVGLSSQIGGHFGIFSCNGHVLKPLNNREYHFYKTMDPRLLPFTVKYCGQISIRVNLSEVDGLLRLSTDSSVQCHASPFHEAILDEMAETTEDGEDDDDVSLPMTFRVNKGGKVEAFGNVYNTFAEKCQSKVVEKLLKGYDKCFIMLENIVSGYRRPCVIDIKMGTRQHGDYCTAEKKLTQLQKCRQSTSETMGARMVGMQLYDRDTKSYSFVNKYEGRRMDRSKLCASLFSFFQTAGISRTRRLIGQLKELRVVLSEAEGFRFFSSSLLIAFDGASESEKLEEVGGSSSHDQKESIVAKMIDFAHSINPKAKYVQSQDLNEEKFYSGPDDGYILGLDSIISILENIVPEFPFKEQRSLKRPYSTPTIASEKLSPS